MSYKIPMGPYHPGLEEPYKLDMICEGETISDVKLNVGFNFRNMEHLAETRNDIAGHRADGAGLRHLLQCPHLEPLPGDGKAYRPDTATPRPVYPHHRRGTGTLALPCALGRHRLQAHGFQDHVHDQLRDSRKDHGRAPGHQRQPRQLFDESRRRSQSRHRGSASHLEDGRGPRRRDDQSRHPHPYFQQNRAVSAPRASVY